MTSGSRVPGRDTRLAAGHASHAGIHFGDLIEISKVLRIYLGLI